MFIIKNIQSRKVNNSFQSQLNEDIKQKNRHGKIFVPAGKSRNSYKIDCETCEKLLHENITRLTRKWIRRK